MAKRSRSSRVDVKVDLVLQHLADDVSVHAVKGRLNLLPISEGIWVRGVLAVDVDLQCVRCLSRVTKTITVEVDEQVVPIDGDSHPDLRLVLQELVIVSTPMRVLCQSDCLRLCPKCGKNLNTGPCNCRPDGVDPHLVALRALIYGVRKYMTDFLREEEVVTGLLEKAELQGHLRDHLT